MHKTRTVQDVLTVAGGQWIEHWLLLQYSARSAHTNDSSENKFERTSISGTGIVLIYCTVVFHQVGQASSATTYAG